MQDIPLDELYGTLDAENGRIGRRPEYVAEAPEAKKHPNSLLEEASRISGGEWQDTYKRAIGYAYRDGIQWIESEQEWELVECERSKKVLLFQSRLNNSMWKVTGVMRGAPFRADRLIYVIEDHDPDTRLQWDGACLSHVRQLETYRPPEGDIHVVKSHVKSPYPLLTSNRFLLGVQSHIFNSEFKTYTYVFTSAPHYFFKCPDTMTSVALTMCVWINPLTNGDCEVKMALSIQPGRFWAAAPLLGSWYEQFRDRFALWERVVNDWETYYGPGRDPKILANRK